MASNRVPKGVTKISVTITFPLKAPATHKPVRRTLTKPATVAQVVSATDGLQAATNPGVCPMLMRLGPELTVIFRNGKGAMLAEATAQVTPGNRGNDGSSPCFPIRYTSASKGAALLGNRWIRMMGRLVGTSIS